MTHLPRLVALDLDGTLLNAAKELTARNIAAVRALAERGVVCVLASGRMYRDCITPHAAQLGLGTPVIAYNGALIVDPVGGDILFERPVRPEDAKPVIDYAREVDGHLNLYFDDTLYCRRPTKWSELYVGRTGAQVVFREDLYEWFDGRPSTKMILLDEPDEIERLCPLWQERVQGRLHVTISDPEYLEFTDPGATKGWALKRVCEQFGVDPADSAAFGDSGNDLPLLEAAGTAVAMANSRPAVKAAADLLAPDHDEDGVAQVIEGWLAEL